MNTKVVVRDGTTITAGRITAFGAERIAIGGALLESEVYVAWVTFPFSHGPPVFFWVCEGRPPWWYLDASPILKTSSWKCLLPDKVFVPLGFAPDDRTDPPE